MTGGPMPLNKVTERREVWPCTDESRALVENAMGAAFEYGELPNYKDRRPGDSAARLTAYRDAQHKLVRRIAHLEQLADIPGVWIHEKNAALSEAEAKERRSVKRTKALAAAAGVSRRGGGGGGRGERKDTKPATAKRAGR